MRLEQFVGIPYISGGRTFDGFDCWGIVMAAALELYDEVWPDYSDYKDSNDMAQTVPLFEARHDWQAIPFDAKMAGDLIIMRLHGVPMHSAIYLGDDRFLHSLNGRDSCVERLSHSGWATRIEGIYRWRKS